ncbi:MAG: hypothetical protein QW279_10965, partial [Candidatus Jordarchaeaceae archaeon]
KITLEGPASIKNVIFMDGMENPPKEIEVDNIGKFSLCVEYKDQQVRKFYFQVKPEIRVLANETVATNPKVIAQINPKVPLESIKFFHGECIEPLTIDSVKRSDDDPTKVVFDLKPVSAEKVPNFCLMVRHNEVETKSTFDLLIRPYIRVLEFEPKKDYYFPNEKITLIVETNRGIVENDFQVKGLGETLVSEIKRLNDSKFTVTLTIPSEIPTGEHQITIEVVKNEVSSFPIQESISIKRCSIEVKVPENGFHVVENIVEIVIYSPAGEPKALVKETETEKSFPLTLSLVDNKGTYTGGIEISEPGKYIVEADGALSQEFLVYPHLQLICPLLKEQKYMLIGDPKDYVLILETNAGIPESNIWVSITDLNHNPLSEMRHRLSDLPEDKIQKIEQEKFVELRLPLDLIIPDKQALRVGSYFLQVTIPPGRQSIKFSNPPTIESDKVVSGIFQLSDSLQIPIKCQAGSKVSIDISACASPEKFLFFPFKREMKKIFVTSNNETSFGFDLSSLSPGLFYEIFASATFNDTNSPTISLGKFALVEAFPYEREYFKTENPLFVIYSSPKLTIKIDEKSLHSGLLPFTIFRIKTRAKKHKVVFDGKLIKAVSYKSAEAPAKTEIRFFSIDSPFLIREETPLSLSNQKDPNLNAAVLKKILAESDKHDIFFIESDASLRTESYMLPIIDFCLNSKRLGTKAIIIFPSNVLYQEQITKIIDCIRKISDQHKITIGLMPFPTPYAEPYLNLEKAEIAEEQSKISPNIAMPCPICGKSGKYVILKLRDSNIFACAICGLSSTAKIIISKILRVNKELITNFVLDEIRLEAYVKTQEERYGPFTCYIPTLLNLIIPCPQCGEILIPAYRMDLESEEEEHCLVCVGCGFFLDFLSFTLMKSRSFPPDIVLISANLCHWLFETPKGGLFNNFYGKIQMCDTCGRIQTLSKPIGRINEDFLRALLQYLADNFPFSLQTFHDQYLELRRKIKLQKKSKY